MAIKSAFISIEDCIKSFMGSTYAQDISGYQRCMMWMMEFNDEMNYDVFKNFKGKFLDVDSATQTAKLPDDYVQYVSMGLVTSNNEFVPLVYNPAIVINPEIPTCDTPNDHCDCGCNEEVCYAFGESNVVTTFTDIVLNGTTYQDSVSICAQNNGDVIRKTCVHTISNPQKKCNYEITFLNVDGNPLIPLNLVWSNFNFIRNGVSYFVGDIPDKATLIAVMTANGFTEDGLTLEWNITQTTDQWTSATYYDSNNLFTTALFDQSGCATPTPIVEEVCYEEKICEMTVLPCGCVVPNDTSIDVLCGANSFMFGRAYTSRYRNNKNFGQTFKQPNGYFGEFKIDINAGIIKFNCDYQWDTVYMEYYSANLVDSKDYLIPRQARACAVAYMYFRSLQMKTNADKWEKQIASKTYYNEKRLLKQRLNPLNLDTFFQSIRYLPISP